jgi:Ca-activated chloride channel homolog
MNQPNKLPLLEKSMKLLVSQLGPNDRVSIVVYAGSDRVVLQPTSGNDHRTISDAIDGLHSGGSTDGSQGIITAYTLARQAFMPGGNNRIILASDGDFNVGITSRAELQRLVEKQRSTGVFLTLLGFGSGNFHDDTMEILADKGNGNYAYIDSLLEAKKVLVKEMTGTLYTLASDVKIQVEFNPAHVGAYRLIGYENRTLADEDFNDDRTDAGEIGAGHHVTALYELIPAGHPSIPQVDPLKYQRTGVPLSANKELLTIKLRYKPKGSQVSQLISMTVSSEEKSLGETSDDFKFAAAVAGYAMLLSDSEHVGSFSWDECLQLILNSRGADLQGYRSEFYQIVEMSQLLSVSS